MKYLKYHQDNFFYFSNQDINYDDLKDNEIIFKSLKNLEILGKRIRRSKHRQIFI